MKPTTTSARLGLVVAAVAVVLTGCASGTGDDPGGAHDDAHASDSPTIDGAENREIIARSMTFAPTALELEAGESINVTLTSQDTTHDLTIDDVDFHLAADRNETVTGGLLIDEPGTYTGYCSVPGHREAGMELTFTVS